MEKKVFIVKYLDKENVTLVFGVFSKEEDAKECVKLINKGYYNASNIAWLSEYTIDDSTNTLIINFWKEQERIEGAQ